MAPRLYNPWGKVGAVNLIGMFQTRAERIQPATPWLRGLRQSDRRSQHCPSLQASGVSRLPSATSPASPAVAPSLLDFNAEFAFTKPDPEPFGQALHRRIRGGSRYTRFRYGRPSWEFGSRRSGPTGWKTWDSPGGFLPEDAVALTWQNLVPQPEHNQPLEIRPQDIDTLIRIAGRGERRGTAIYLTLHADTAGGVVQQNNASRWC